jgi:hypothetical protein
MAAATKKSVEFTDEEIIHLLAMLRVAGFKEKRDVSESLRSRRNDEMRIIGRIMKRLRKAYNCDKTA